MDFRRPPPFAVDANFAKGCFRFFGRFRRVAGCVEKLRQHAVKQAKLESAPHFLVGRKAVAELLDVISRIGAPRLRPDLIRSADRSEIKDAGPFAIVAALSAEL